MHYPIISKDQFYEGLVSRLKKVIPEFHSLFDDDEGQYIVFGEFCNFIEEAIKNQSLFKRCIHFINECIEEGDYKTQELISVEFFEPLYASKAIVDDVKKHLNEKSLALYEKGLEEFITRSLLSGRGYNG